MANNAPIFVKQPRNSSVKLITGAASADGVGSSLLFQSDTTNGSRVHAVSAVYAGTITTTTVLRLFLETGGTYHLIAERALAAFAQAQGVASPVFSLLEYAYAAYLDPSDRFLTLDSGDALYVSIIDTIEANLHVSAFGGDY